MNRLNNHPELKPCPFCGQPAKIAERCGEGYSTYGRFWYEVGCTDCNIVLYDREEFDDNWMLIYPEMECVERWNMRADDVRDTSDK